MAGTGFAFTGDLPNGLVEGRKVPYTATASFDGATLTVTFDTGSANDFVWIYTPGWNEMAVSSGSAYSIALDGYSEGQTVTWYFL